MTKTARSRLGDAGEGHVARLLEARGWRVIARQWRCEAGELDLVALDGDELVFVEVKTRRGDRAGRAEEAITRAKGARLMASAEWFVAEHPDHQHRIWRIDLAALTLDASGRVVRLNLVENAIVSG